MATTVLLRLAALTGDARYRAAAERALATVGPYLARYPTGFAQWLCALELAHAGLMEVAIIGDPDDDEVQPASRRGRGLPPVPGPGRARRPRPGGAAAGGPVRASWPGDRVRVPRLRLPPAGHEPEALDALLIGA